LPRQSRRIEIFALVTLILFYSRAAAECALSDLTRQISIRVTAM
jgi:hypothetical protein